MQPSSPEAQTVEFRDVLSRFARQWRIIVGFLVAGLIGALLAIHLYTSQYTAEMIIRPTQETDSLSSALASLSGLSSITSALGTANPDFPSYQALLSSTDVADQLIKNDPKILQGAFWDKWDSDNNTWSRPFFLIAWAEDAGRWLIGLPAWHPPDRDDLAQLIGDYVDVVADSTSTTYTLSYSNPDPKFAVKFLVEAHTAADAVLREAALKKSKFRVAKLKEWLTEETLQDQRDALMSLMSTELNNLLTLDTDKYLASDMLATATPSTDPTWPSVPLFIAAGMLLGLFTGCIVAWIVDAMGWAHGLYLLIRPWRWRLPASFTTRFRRRALQS